MLAFTILCFSLLVSLVHASPLRQRDVWVPHITSPTANTVWTVGTEQTVTWDTSDMPAQVTNPKGQIILGHEENGSLNLQFNSPLAQNFLLTDGKVQITVPDVPPRDDYLIVLFGDSGNTSPSFVIASISGGSSSTASSATTISKAAASSSSTLITNPIPITGTTITGGVSTTTPITSAADFTTSTSSSTSSSTAPQTTSTSPASTTSGTSSKSSASSGTGTGTGTAVGSNTTTSGAWSLHSKGSLKLLCVGMASFILTLVI